MEIQNIFDELKKILQVYEKKLLIVKDKPDNYYLNSPPTEKNRKGEFFGAVQIKKNYVAFHLMPVYCFPQLLENISIELKKRMQGKSCFNFKTEDENLFAEVRMLTEMGVEKYQMEGKLKVSN